MHIKNVYFAMNLIRLLRRNNLTVDELGPLSGVHFIESLCSGRYSPSATEVRRLAKALNASAVELRSPIPPEPEEHPIFIPRFCNLCDDRNMSVQDLADRIKRQSKHGAISKQTLNKFFSGESFPSAPQIAAIAEALEVSVAELLGHTTARRSPNLSAIAP